MPTAANTLDEMTSDARRTLRRHLLTIQDLAAALLQLDDLTQIADHLDNLEDRAYVVRDLIAEPDDTSSFPSDRERF